MRTRTPARRAATAVEVAVVGSVFFLLLFLIIAGAVIVFRHQQVAALACEGSRYASVRGGLYAQETGLPAATASEIASKANERAGLDPDGLSVTVQLRAP